MDATLITLGTWPVTIGSALLAVAGLAAFLLLTLVVRGAGFRRRQTLHAEALEKSLADVIRAQSEMNGRMQTMAEIFGSRQSDMGRLIGDRLDGLGQRLGQSMTETTQTTSDNLRQLHERIAVIDRAQATIADLTDQVGDLRRILSDKQARGAFGQGRMEQIIRDGLPSGGYAFQPVLSNNTRPDCIVFMPNEAPGLVIDAKFPLEALQHALAAETDAERKAADQQFKRDIAKHVLDIRDRYLLPGETQDTAFMFVPSESVFAELHEHHADLVQKAHRARVVIVSPALLMLSIQVVQALLKDARMREEAHIIQSEVAHLMDDVNRLAERVINLQKHFAQANRDVEQILVSSEKISRRAARIETLEFETDHPARAAPATNGSASVTGSEPDPASLSHEERP